MQESIRQSVGEAIKLVFPKGSRGDGTWTAPPDWPPDLFGVCAYLLEQSGAYAWLGPGGAENLFGLTQKANNKLCQWASEWRTGQWLKERNPAAARALSQRGVGELWRALWGCRNHQLMDTQREIRVPKWAAYALQLLIVADEASVGIGFFPPAGDPRHPPPPFQVAALNNFFFPTGERKVRRDRPRMPYSIGWFLDPQVLCVLPKTRTPGVGCTIRSLSHHLALLGGRGEVRARWHVNPVRDESTDVFNLLLIPFPYRMSGRSFRGTAQSERWGFFDLDQTWLPKNGARVDSQAFSRFVLDCAAAAEEEVGSLHGLLLPELALNESCYGALAKASQRRLPKLRFLIAGVHQRRGISSRNHVKVTALYPHMGSGPQGNRSVELTQSKHHRWKLDRDQIYRYSLGDALDPQRYWWENVDVHGRELNFFVFSNGSCFTTLICEDLARVDPVQRALRSVGPNLVFALLMDGPQLVSRWPGRFCSVLAEDPGSSVLTLTSLALIERSSIAAKSNSRCVALWKDPTGKTSELDLPPGAHALCITLRGRKETEYTLDGRGDGNAACYWSLSGSVPLTLKRPPAWI